MGCHFLLQIYQVTSTQKTVGSGKLHSLPTCQFILIAPTSMSNSSHHGQGPERTTVDKHHAELQTRENRLSFYLKAGELGCHKSHPFLGRKRMPFPSHQGRLTLIAERRSPQLSRHWHEASPSPSCSPTRPSTFLRVTHFP